ncbi:hypothetical protein [Photobacterium sp. TLY01]|uniref:hypothetical protein n=1 Tax=Photobacterium sp. TLY01 TaxID=2907534 RepID=UPI001F2655CA|nr:hypothetical protein [Photobacterium sp. TLY01]UIP29278.1 hypothetical protein LN341_07410 [Photobacterium sp. TLY01]
MHQSMLMTRAVSASGAIVSIDMVGRGLACGCTCIVCGSRLIARHGAIRKHSFAHEVDGQCNWSGETELHILAKEVLAADKGISFTHCTIDGVAHSLRVSFTTIEQEPQLGNVKPDILGTTADGDEFIIEIAVHHACEETKILHYRKQRMNAIEIILPPDLLDDIEILDLNFVRKAIAAATIKPLSINPLSPVWQNIAERNKQIVEQQADQLREIRQEIYDERLRYKELKQELAHIQKSIMNWEAYKASQMERANRYRHELNQKIESQEHVKNYRKEVQHYTQQTEELNRKFEMASAEVDHQIQQYKDRLRTKARIQILENEVKSLHEDIQFLKSARSELISDRDLSALEHYIKKIDSAYVAQYAELNYHWGNIQKIRPDLKKPDFISPENQHLKGLPKFKTYKDIRG